MLSQLAYYSKIYGPQVSKQWSAAASHLQDAHYGYICLPTLSAACNWYMSCSWKLLYMHAIAFSRCVAGLFLQVLLQLNIAYYLPSIPILLLAGHVEKLLDEQFGSTASMAIRLTVGKHIALFTVAPQIKAVIAVYVSSNASAGLAPQLAWPNASLLVSGQHLSADTPLEQQCESYGCP